jgi:hypothetical protein
MPDAEVFRERARRCRELLQFTVAPELIEQLRIWAREFDDEADKIEAELIAARQASHHSIKPQYH